MVKFQTSENTGGGDYNDTDLSNQELIVRFMGFRRDKDSGELLTREQFNGYGYIEVDGRIWPKKSEKNPKPKVLRPDQESKAYNTKIYWDLEVVSPAEMIGEMPPCSTNLKGIRVIPDDTGDTILDFQVKGQMVAALLEVANAFGFRALAVDPTSALFDIAYVEKYAAPLAGVPTVGEVVTDFLEPILLDAADGGRLVRVKTQPASNWVINAEVRALDADECALIAAQTPQPAAATEEAALEAGVPFDVGEAEEPIDIDELAEGPSRSELEATVRQYVPGKVSMEKVLAWLARFHVQHDSDSILGSLSNADLEKLAIYVAKPGAAQFTL